MLQHFERLSTGLPIQPLLEAIARKPELWRDITARQSTPGSAHKYTESIFLRWARELTIEACFNDIEAVNYPALGELPEALPLIADVIDRVDGGKLGRVLITSLAPGGTISKHSDEGAVADHYERFHICLQSDEGNTFSASIDQAETVRMRPGQLWWFNHKAEHWLANHSTRPRLHLIIDVVAPKYRRERRELSA